MVNGPSSSWEGELVLLLQLFQLCFVSYTRAAQGPNFRSGSMWDPILLRQPWEFAMGFLVR